MARIDTIERFLFSNDSRTILTAVMTHDIDGLGAFASATNGYAGGGYSATHTLTTDMDKIQFSDDTKSTLGTGLSTARRARGMASSVAGYMGGGYVGGSTVDTVDRFLFSNDSRTTLGTGLSTPRNYGSGCSGGIAGYFGGGHTDHPLTSEDVTTVDRFLFADDTRTTLGVGLSVARQDLCGAGQQSA